MKNKMKNKKIRKQFLFELSLSNLSLEDQILLAELVSTTEDTLKMTAFLFANTEASVEYIWQYYNEEIDLKPIVLRKIA